MVNCVDLGKWAQRFYDRELIPSEQAALESHLRVCAGCHARFQAVGAVVELLQESLSFPELTPDFTKRLMTEIRRDAFPTKIARPAYRWLPGRGMAVPDFQWTGVSERPWTEPRQWLQIWRLLDQISHQYYLELTSPAKA